MHDSPSAALHRSSAKFFAPRPYSRRSCRKSGSRWLLDPIPCTHWSPGWHHVQEYDELINNATQYRYDTLVFDGTPLAINQTWNVNPTTCPDQVGLQFQLDEDPTATALHEWVDKVTLTAW